jgi:hypothetical protein
MSNVHLHQIYRSICSLSLARATVYDGPEPVSLTNFSTMLWTSPPILKISPAQQNYHHISCLPSLNSARFRNLITKSSHTPLFLGEFCQEKSHVSSNSATWAGPAPLPIRLQEAVTWPEVTSHAPPPTNQVAGSGHVTESRDRKWRQM